MGRPQYVSLGLWDIFVSCLLPVRTISSFFIFSIRFCIGFHSYLTMHKCGLSVFVRGKANIACSLRQTSLVEVNVKSVKFCAERAGNES